jgi:hypothetical protein
MIHFLAFFFISLFHVLGDYSRIRELYSSALAGSYVRLLMQYIGSEEYRLWEYKELPWPMTTEIQIPFLLDFTVYPVAAYLFIQYMPKPLRRKVLYYLGWIAGGVGIEILLHWSNHMEFHRWNYGYSFLLFTLMALLVDGQYRLFRKWCINQ